MGCLRGKVYNLTHHILICHHHLLLWQMCFPTGSPACNECNAILLLILHNHHLIRTHMLRAPGLSICCGFSRNSDYIIVTSQTVKIRHTEKLLQLKYIPLCWAWTFLLEPEKSAKRANRIIPVWDRAYNRRGTNPLLTVQKEQNFAQRKSHVLKLRYQGSNFTKMKTENTLLVGIF